MTQAAPELWTTRKLLLWMRQAFTKKGIDDPGRMSDDLLSHVLGCERLRLYMEFDRPASPLERETLRALVQRALNHEPIQYLTGEESFYSLRFKVDRRVLIPRPSTSTIVDEVLQHARATPGYGGAAGPSAGEGVFIADICTGSGCIAVTLLKQLPKARAVATDLSADALAVAAENAKRHGVADRLDLLQGDLLAALDQHAVARTEGSLHYLVSNPPYIPDHEWGAVEPNVKDHEPHLALRGGVDGMDLVRRVIASGAHYLRPGGVMAVEIAASTGKPALALAQSTPGLSNARLVRDLEGHDRVVMATRA